MKSLKFEDLRGTNTAIHCPTQEDWDKVSKICGYKWEHVVSKWRKDGTRTCIDLSGNFSPIDFYERNYYTIITAADFIAANTEQAPDLSGTRPAIEWLELLPEPYRGKALEAVKDVPRSPNEICEYKDCVDHAFWWGQTKENLSFWDSVSRYLKNPPYPLPPLPSEGVEAEKVEAETDIQKLTKEVAQLRKFFYKFVEEYTKRHPDLPQGIKKQPDTAEPAISPTPAEPEVKLPVTIKERDKYLKSLVDGERDFYHIEDHSVFLNEKTQLKSIAFKELSQISEAQNEIVPRGEFVWYAEYEIANDKIKPRKRVMDTTAYGYGLITFHSEQGIKDCIEANRELWMDLLKGE
jgi:hypothetical protein